MSTTTHACMSATRNHGGMDSADPRRSGDIVWIGGAAIAAVALYLVFLGWHAQRTRSPGGGECTGPYETWQVVGLALGSCLVVAIAAWFGRPWPVVVVSCTVSMTVLWAADAATVKDPCNIGANLWPIGATFLLTGSVVGLSAVAASAAYLRSLLDRRRARGESLR